MGVKALPECLRIGDIIFVRFKNNECLSVRYVTNRQGMLFELTDKKIYGQSYWHKLNEDFIYVAHYKPEKEG
jgi:hypothetical protein